MNVLLPLNKLIRLGVLSERWIHVDESPIDFYNPNKCKGYIWSRINPGSTRMDLKLNVLMVKKYF